MTSQFDLASFIQTVVYVPSLLKLLFVIDDSSAATKIKPTPMQWTI